MIIIIIRSFNPSLKIIIVITHSKTNTFSFLLLLLLLLTFYCTCKIMLRNTSVLNFLLIKESLVIKKRENPYSTLSSRLI